MRSLDYLVKIHIVVFLPIVAGFTWRSRADSGDCSLGYLETCLLTKIFNVEMIINGFYF